MMINPYIFGSPTELLPTQGTFAQTQTIDLFEVAPSALLDFTDDFSSNNWTFTQQVGTPTFTVSGGVGNLTIPAGAFGFLRTNQGGALTVPQGWMEVEVTQAGTATSGSDDRIGIGYTLDVNTRIMGEYNKRASTIQCAVRNNGGTTSTISILTGITLTAPFKLGVSLCGNIFTIWYNQSGTWTVAGSRNLKGLRDLNTASNYANLLPSMLFVSDAASSWKIDNFKAGRFGSLGLKDPMIIYKRDGTPLLDGSGRLLLSTTALHPNVGASPSTRGLYTAIYAIDLDTYAWSQVGVVFFQRSGQVWNDVNLTGIEQPDGSYAVFDATWGNPAGTSTTTNAIKIQAGSMAASDFIGTHLVSMADVTLPVPSGGLGTYDPSIIWDGSRYLMAYAVTNFLDFSTEKFYPVLAQSTDLSTWTSVGNDSAQSAYEGPFMYNAAGSWYMIVARRSNPAVYDNTMTGLGQVGAALVNNTDTIPHAVIVAHGSKRILFSFSVTRTANGYSSRRDLLVWESARYV